MSPLARLVASLGVMGLAACSGSEFASGTQGRLADGGPADGGRTSGGTGGGTGMAGSGTGTGGATGTAGGSSAGGASSAGGRGGSGGVGTGATSATGGVVGNGGAGAGGKIGSGGNGAGGVTAAGGTTGTGGTGGPPNSGDCTLDKATCGTNSRCVEVTPGGYRVCTTPYPEATSCTGTGMGQCCKSSDCSNGAKCYPTPLAPKCGGIIAVGSNVCSGDICTSDAACGTSQICVPAGTLDRKVRMCVPAGCHHDADCTVAPGGVCAPVSGGCCSGAVGLYCVYPGGCRQNKDCASGNCQINAKGAAECSPDPAICPL